jgi:hypothetical protein
MCMEREWERYIDAAVNLVSEFYDENTYIESGSFKGVIEVVVHDLRDISIKTLRKNARLVGFELLNHDMAVNLRTTIFRFKRFDYVPKLLNLMQHLKNYGMQAVANKCECLVYKPVAATAPDGLPIVACRTCECYQCCRCDRYIVTPTFTTDRLDACGYCVLVPLRE